MMEFLVICKVNKKHGKLKDVDTYVIYTHFSTGFGKAKFLKKERLTPEFFSFSTVGQIFAIFSLRTKRGRPNFLRY